MLNAPSEPKRAGRRETKAIIGAPVTWWTRRAWRGQLEEFAGAQAAAVEV
jgi:hypothetical protein